MIAIVAGVPEELAAVRRSLEDARPSAFGDYRAARGRLAGRDAIIAVAGDGAARAARILDALLDTHACAAVVGIGVAGGLTEDLPVGTLVAPARVRGRDGATMTPDPALFRAALRAGALSATAVSTGSLVATVSAKRSLAATLGERPAIADLESHAWARVAAARGLPWVILRVVSDAVGEDLPEFIIGSQREDGSIDRGRIAARALAAPTRLATLLRLRRRVLDAAAALAAAVGAIMNETPGDFADVSSREAM